MRRKPPTRGLIGRQITGAAQSQSGSTELSCAGTGIPRRKKTFVEGAENTFPCLYPLYPPHCLPGMKMGLNPAVGKHSGAATIPTWQKKVYEEALRKNRRDPKYLSC